MALDRHFPSQSHFLSSPANSPVAPAQSALWGTERDRPLQPSSLRTRCHLQMHEVLTFLPICGDKDHGLWGH